MLCDSRDTLIVEGVRALAYALDAELQCMTMFLCALNEPISRGCGKRQSKSNFGLLKKLAAQSLD
jgi:hypothetical protein